MVHIIGQGEHINVMRSNVRGAVSVIRRIVGPITDLPEGNSFQICLSKDIYTRVHQAIATLENIVEHSGFSYVAKPNKNDGTGVQTIDIHISLDPEFINEVALAQGIEDTELLTRVLQAKISQANRIAVGFVNTLRTVKHDVPKLLGELEPK